MVDDTGESCFVIMPISTPQDKIASYNDDDHFTNVLKCLFEPAIESVGMNMLPPQSRGSVQIHADIIGKLISSDLVLCDMSSLNANVFFELGIRTALNKPTAFVIDDKTQNVPFDLSNVNHIRYDSKLWGPALKDEIERLARHLKDTITASSGKNALWHLFSPEESSGRSRNFCQEFVIYEEGPLDLTQSAPMGLFENTMGTSLSPSIQIWLTNLDPNPTTFIVAAKINGVVATNYALPKPHGEDTRAVISMNPIRVPDDSKVILEIKSNNPKDTHVAAEVIYTIQ